MSNFLIYIYIYIYIIYTFTMSNFLIYIYIYTHTAIKEHLTICKCKSNFSDFSVISSENIKLITGNKRKSIY